MGRYHLHFRSHALQDNVSLHIAHLGRMEVMECVINASCVFVKDGFKEQMTRALHGFANIPWWATSTAKPQR